MQLKWYFHLLNKPHAIILTRRRQSMELQKNEIIIQMLNTQNYEKQIRFKTLLIIFVK